MRCDDDEVRTANERTPIKMQREEAEEAGGSQARNNKYPKKKKDRPQNIATCIVSVCVCEGKTRAATEPNAVSIY